MKKRLLCIVAVLTSLSCILYTSIREANANNAPVLHVYDESGNELPVRELSDDEVEQMLNVPTVALSMEDFAYFLATDESFMNYASVSTPDFRNELAKTAQGAKEIEGTEDYELFDEPYLEGPPINMEHFADMVDYYKDRNESVVLLVYYHWDPFRSEAYSRKFEAYASAFERADILLYWGESREANDWGNEDANVTLGEVLEMVPVDQYDHLLIASTEGALSNAEELAQQITSRDDFGEVVILTYQAASLRACPESATVLTEKLGVTPILRPLIAWEDKVFE